MGSKIYFYQEEEDEEDEDEGEGKGGGLCAGGRREGEGVGVMVGGASGLQKHSTEPVLHNASEIMVENILRKL